MKEKKKKNNILKEKTKVNFEKFRSKKIESNDDLTIKLIKVKKKKKKGQDELALKKETIPKAARKYVERFSKRNNLPSSVVEEEISNLDKDIKAHEAEIKNSKMFNNNFIEANRYLIDFEYLNKIIERQSKDFKKLNLKKELDNMIYRVDKLIDFTQHLDDNDEE